MSNKNDIKGTQAITLKPNTGSDKYVPKNLTHKGTTTMRQGTKKQ